MQIAPVTTRTSGTCVEKSDVEPKRQRPWGTDLYWSPRAKNLANALPLPLGLLTEGIVTATALAMRGAYFLIYRR